MFFRALYYNPEKPSAFSKVNKLSAALPKKKQSHFRAWLEHQEIYTMNRSVRKKCLSNPYTVSNIMHLWQCDILDVKSIAKYHDMYRYILSVIDVFSKYLHLVAVKTKSGPTITSVFCSLFQDDDSRRPVWVNTDKGKEFLNKHIQYILGDEDIQFQVCRNPDVKCAVVERAHRTIRNQIFSYFTHMNTYRYIDVLPKFVKA